MSSNNKTVRSVSNESDTIKTIKTSSINTTANIDDDLFKLPSEEPKFIRQTDNIAMTDETGPIPIDIKNVFLSVL